MRTAFAQKPALSGRIGFGIPIAPMATGVALSLLLHGLLTAWLWHRVLPGHRFDQFDAPHVAALQVRLSPIAQPSVPVPPSVAPSPEKQAPARATRGATRPLRPARETAAANPSGDAQGTPLNAPASTTSAVQAPAQHLDLAAVPANVAAIVAQEDRGQDDTPVAQLRKKPLYATDPTNPVGDTIAHAARPDCRDRIAGTGLLAPLAIMAMAFDQKDSGCKW
jgi:hypothetical protein